MRTHITFWIIWLLVWASGSHATTCTQVTSLQVPAGVTVHITSEGVQATCNQPACAQPQITCGGQGSTATGTTIRSITTNQGVANVALHEYVYKGDFAGLREKMKQLETKDNQPTLIGALQSTDDKGLTIAHLLACAGRTEELFLITQAGQKIQDGLAPLSQQVFKRASLESLSWNASCTACRPERTEFEVVPHLRLELTNPKQTVLLYGNVTPLECAAAHGHVLAMKLLMQRGVQPGRALVIAQHFGLENQLIEAVSHAKAAGGLGVDLHPDLPDKVDMPLRKPRQRRTELQFKSKNKSGSTSSTSSSKQKAATAAAQHQHQHGSCSPPPAPKLTMTQDSTVQRPGGPPSIIGTVSTSILGIRGKDQEASKPVTTPTQLSEAMDVTALWLLSIMLLFPAWSTACLIWRKMAKRRWAVQESASKVRSTVRAVAKPFRRESAAAAAPVAAATGGSVMVPQRSGGSGSDSKGAKGTAAPRQQRKPGPSIALPGSGSDPRVSAKVPAVATSPTGGLSRAISAPEATLRTHASSAQGTDTEDAAAGHAGGVRRQGSSVAAVAAGVSVAPVAAKPARAAAAADTAPVPVSVHRQGSNAGAAAKAAEKSGKGAAPAARSSSSKAAADDNAPPASTAPALPATNTTASKQKRNKHAASTAAAAGAAHAKEDVSKARGSSNKHAAACKAAGSKAASGVDASSSPGSSAGNDAVESAAPKVMQQPHVLHRAVKPDKSSTVSSPAKGGASTGRAAADSYAASSTQTPPKSALSTALKPGRTSPRDSGTSSGDFDLGSPTARGSAHYNATGRRPHAMTLPLGSPSGRTSSSPHSMLSPGGSGRFKVAAAAAAAAAVRDAAAASLAATASLRRTASGGVMPSPRSPLKDLDDVLARARDQDRPHGLVGPASSGSGHDVASSAPPSNAWTAAAAAARAARAAGVPAKAQREGEEDMHGPESPRSAAGAADTACKSAAAETQDGPLEAHAAAEVQNHSSAMEASNDDKAAERATAAGTATAGSYVDSFTAAAVAAGILPSPTGTKPDVGSTEPAATAASPKHGLLRANDSSFDAAEAAAATAYAAAVAALPSDAEAEAAAVSTASTHSPELDPPVTLLPSSLLARLDAAPGRAPAPGGITRSISALEPKVVQDLADLVAATIAQEVAQGKHKGAAVHGGSGSPQHAAETTGTDAAGVQASGDATEAAASAVASTVGVSAGMSVGFQLVNKTLDEVLAEALTASKNSATDGAPASTQQPAGLALDLSAGAGKQDGEHDFFNFSSADLFADLAQKLRLPARHSPQKPQQQLQDLQQQLDAAVPAPVSQTGDQQQDWFGSPAVIVSGAMQLGGHMQVLCDPPGLMNTAAMGMNAAVGGMNMNVPASAALQGPSGLQGPPGLQMQPAAVMPTSLPIGATLIPAQMPAQGFAPMQQQHQVIGQPLQQQQVMAVPMQQQHVMAHPMPQQQQVVIQQHPHVVTQQQPMPQPMMVSMGAGQQPVQVVSMQPVAAPAGPQHTQLIRLPNGQLVAMQGSQGSGQVGGVPVMAAGPAHAGGPVVLGPGGVQQVPMQQQMVQGPRVFMPGHMAGGPVMVQQVGQQQQVLTQQGPHMVQVQMPGGMVQNMAMRAGPVASSGLVMQPVQRRQGMQQGGPQMVMYAHQNHSNSAQLSSSPAQVTILGRSPVSATGVGGGAGQHKASNLGDPNSTGGLSCSPAKVTVLAAPAGPGVVADADRHSETGVYVSWTNIKAKDATVGSTDNGGQLQAAAESAQMASDLDALLNQANEQMGWSSVPNSKPA